MSKRFYRWKFIARSAIDSKIITGRLDKYFSTKILIYKNDFFWKLRLNMLITQMD